jgi:hypothetical protein
MHQLGYQYREISEVVTMEKSNSQWRFKGGLPTKIYRIVCLMLSLGNKIAYSRVVGFESYTSMD